MWRPVLAGLCEWRQVLDGTYTLCDIADMNDALTVQAENERRHAEANRPGD